MRARNNNTPLRSSMSCRGRLPEFSCCHEESSSSSSLLASPERPSGRAAVTAGSSGIIPSTIMSPASSIRPSTEIRLGVYYYYRTQEPTSRPRVLFKRGPPPRERIDLWKAQIVYPAFDAWVLYR